ncbi:hypothetical protein [Mycobacterium yunnanensis]|uniref:hypothetical protein n=1 Tax=Mycobacterium yunnanensis TaxID=368477 RepID=UPI0027E25BF4|nr:hypothetical protein [Mycobacterium yunnanensis]
MTSSWCGACITGTPSTPTVGGRYLDKYQKREGGWGFVERSIVTDWARVDDPSPVRFDHPLTRGTPRGTLDANDPSHQFFSLLGSR